jgi:SAM-dependent methyltransferase
MTTFGAYARYYDLLYATKDYEQEAEYVLRIIRRSRPGARTLLDLGCGTGVHACAFARAGYRVTGVDQSASMLEYAQERARKARLESNDLGSVEFVLDDVREIALSRRFDVVTALFHVISYLPTNDALHAALSKIAQHIEPDGLLIFDHWYGPAVLTERPTQRVKIFEDDYIKIVRIATPRLHHNCNLVDVNYDIVVIEKASSTCRQFAETHRMRYLFRPELEDLLLQHNFRSIAFTEWLSDQAPNLTSWNAVVTATALP